jgi:hypothetical protein
MLSYIDYQNKWTNPTPAGFGLMLKDMPSYHEYVIREIYQQDYLDLYIGAMTFNRKLVGEIYYVQITGNLILDVLGIPLDPLYTISSGGNDYIMVDYEYQWNNNELLKPRSIKYIMLGEAAPQIVPRAIDGYNKTDKQNSYFYNIKHEKGSNWLSAPVKAFVKSSTKNLKSKRNKLLFLADNGFILVDLFPFSFSYSSSFREYLNDKKVSSLFFKNDVIPLLTTLLQNDVIATLAFSGPPTIHHFIANEIAFGRICLPNNIICRKEMNNTEIQTSTLPKLNFKRNWIPGDLLNGYKIQTDIIPFYGSCTYNAKNPAIGPQENYIKIAFYI